MRFGGPVTVPEAVDRLVFSKGFHCLFGFGYGKRLEIFLSLAANFLVFFLRTQVVVNCAPSETIHGHIRVC